MKVKFEEIKKGFKSIRVRLFLTLSLTILLIIFVLVFMNNVVLETFYIYSKERELKSVYERVNNYYKDPDFSIDLKSELEKIAIRNNFDILIQGLSNECIYTSNKDFYATFYQLGIKNRIDISQQDVLEENDSMVITKVQDYRNNITYVLLSAQLDNGYGLYMRIPINSIQESVKISNNFLYMIAGITILIAAIIVTVISRKFTDSIVELNVIAKKMSNLDFSHRYKTKNVDDEINDLGNSINLMSTKLEKTINQLRENNIELEKDIEEKSKINEMRTQFISDVSHELKTPLALIQGYSEGLIENVNTSEEDRKFYAEVILDETNKMDKLVKQLLELMKLEYGKREFNNKDFNIVELEKEVIRKSKVMLEEKNISVEFKANKEIYTYADDFYIEQVMTNYFTNAIKHAKEVDGKKIIRIKNKINKNTNKLRISVFNTGEKLSKENRLRIWNRFYKADKSRNRQDGGIGIGLAFVKAIMNNYKNDYGVLNKENGVEFYFELDLSNKKTAENQRLD